MDSQKLTDGVDTSFLTGLHSSFHSTPIDDGFAGLLSNKRSQVLAFIYTKYIQ
jgi:hypothetical protein